MEQDNCIVANPYKGASFINRAEKEYRSLFRTSENIVKIMGIVDAVLAEIR